ncbi:hypothetical protein SDC9_143950 [bioreactor metagenome]|uniref:Uncharacterized protein n=1 Tax=bioreactor metagenome TaxID=1076179 RepID=A0A645E5K3_9ZZZZ
MLDEVDPLEARFDHRPVVGQQAGESSPQQQRRQAVAAAPRHHQRDPHVRYDGDQGAQRAGLIRGRGQVGQQQVGAERDGQQQGAAEAQGVGHHCTRFAAM